MKTKFLTLPLVAMLAFAAAPAQAVSIPSGSSASGSASSTQSMTRQQLKQQRKLQKQCAKLAAGKIKSEAKRARLTSLCKPATNGGGPTLPESGVGGGSTGNTGNSGSTGGSAGGNTGSSSGGSSGSSNTGGAGGSSFSPNPPVVGSGNLPSVEGPPTNQVPEPASLALLGLGLAGLGWARSRRK